MSEHDSTTDARDDPRPALSDEEKRLLLDLARQALNDYLGEGTVPGWETDAPALLEPRATFVTLRRRGSGDLRGCRGECQPQRPLIEAVVHMAIASAIDDSRFPPVTIDEVPELSIHISALTPMRPIDPEDVEVGRHGLWLVSDRGSGLLLPEVPVRFGWDRQQFLRGVCRKAGLPDDAWKADYTQLYGFESEVWGEEG